MVRAELTPGPVPSLPNGTLSVIVPVHNQPHHLATCLSALAVSSPLGVEVIVVDDGSSDETPAVATRAGVRLERLAISGGPAAARNVGARRARGDILFFVDADVVVSPSAIRRVVEAFEQDPGLGAVFGSYDAAPRAPGAISQYRNLLHHWMHQQGEPDASTFWAGCGAIRRSVFEEVGGFDAARYPRPSIEDIELGYRLRRAGHRIRLDKQLQGTHLKQWTLRSLIHTDLARRAIPWTRLILETGRAPRDLNLSRGQRASGGLVALAAACVALAGIRRELVGLALAAVLGVLVLNWKLFAFFSHQRGLGFAVACVPLHLLYYILGLVGFTVEWVASTRRGRIGSLRVPHG